MSDPAALETVNAFMKAASHRDYDAALGYLADDVEYQNMPLPAVTGKQAVRDTLDMLLAICSHALAGVGARGSHFARRGRFGRGCGC